MPASALDELKARYTGLLQTRNQEVRSIVRDARTEGVKIHIVCIGRKQYDDAKCQLEGLPNVRITATIEDTPRTELRIRWSDFMGQTPYSEG